VKVTMMYRGRQMAHIDLGRAVLDRVATELKDVAKIEQDPKLEGRNMSMVLAPKYLEVFRCRSRSPNARSGSVSS
jgi:translation initiation factor IF-3